MADMARVDDADNDDGCPDDNDNDYDSDDVIVEHNNKRKAEHMENMKKLQRIYGKKLVKMHRDGDNDDNDDDDFDDDNDPI